MDGYSVSFDLETLENGNFGNELEKRIKKCRDFVIVLNPGIFDCFTEPDYNPKDDWVRIEIGCALAAQKNIVPLKMEDFTYPRRLPNDIKDITKINAIDLSTEHFEAAYEKLKSTFLISKPNWRIRHRKRMISFISIVFIALAFFAFFHYKQKETEAAEAKLAAARADSIRIVREMELKREADSINAAMEAELARAADSINDAMEEEIARVADSVKKYMEAKAAKAQNAQKNAVQSAPKKTTQQSVPKSSPKKTTQQNAPKSSPKKTTQQKSSKK